ncbi:MAG: DegT/DnrJ/EryC1/StrS family aminotransferase [Candidatus Marinimicrobia bacterium]|nr:DegT/DnrJ/EryC1/StrS family aminotransferase [Candidatus Neomarinimicrobiota bacterium]
MKPVPLLDLRAQHATIRTEIAAAVAELFESQQFILGAAVEACEAELAAYCGVECAVGVSSGTDALLLAMMCEGIGPGAEVVTTPYTFFATCGSIARLGAKPVLVDIDPRTYNLDVGQVEAAITPRTRALMPVHLYGQMADMPALSKIACARNLPVIEDAAQAIGAECAGRRAGQWGLYGCFSFFPSKNLGGAGDGGLITTCDPQRAEKLRRLRNHGMHPKYHHQLIGGNFRLDALQAAVVRVKLRHLDQWTAARQANARRYDVLFAAAGLAGNPVGLPTHPHGAAAATPAGERHVFNQYVVRVPRRDALRDHLTAAGIGAEVYYPVPLHLQACFADLGYPAGRFPHSERAARETLALPIYPELTDDQAACVVDAIRAFYR